MWNFENIFVRFYVKFTTFFTGFTARICWPNYYRNWKEGQGPLAASNVFLHMLRQIWRALFAAMFLKHWGNVKALFRVITSVNLQLIHCHQVIFFKIFHSAVFFFLFWNKLRHCALEGKLINSGPQRNDILKRALPILQSSSSQVFQLWMMAMIVPL